MIGTSFFIFLFGLVGRGKNRQQQQRSLTVMTNDLWNEITDGKEK